MAAASGGDGMTRSGDNATGLLPFHVDGKPAPHQLSSPTSREGARRIRPLASGLRELVLDALRDAGPVSLDGLGGGTIQELAEVVATMRGKPVKETTICGRLGELRKQQLIFNSGRTRMGNGGVQVTVYVHRVHAGEHVRGGVG